MVSMHVRRWTSEEFMEGRAAWQSLLARSGADPLFMSWDWLSAWWKHHAAPLQAELCVLGVYAEHELCGLAPFYQHRGVHRRLISARRLELLGNAWRDPDAVFSEYLDVIAAHELSGGVCAALRQWLQDDDGWDEILFCNMREDALAQTLGRACTGMAYVREAESMTGWSVALPDSFDAFASQLSSNTRRKALHQREKLDRISCETVGGEERRAVLSRLEQLIARRWNRSVSDDARARFHAELLDSMGLHDALRLTQIRSGAGCVSVMLNLRVAGTEYYLQSGFDETYARGLSPGYLHLGYAIEAACRDGLRRFDFLAGRGLHRDYKRDFAAASARLQTLHIVRKPSLRTLFRIADRLRGSGQID